MMCVAGRTKAGVCMCLNELPAAPAGGSNALLKVLSGHEPVATQLTSCAFAPGEALMRQGLPINHVYFPLRGTVSTTLQITADDVEVSLTVVGHEGAIGCEATHVAPTGAVACTSVIAWRLPFASWCCLNGSEHVRDLFSS